MDLYEYQARELLAEENINVPEAIYAADAGEVSAAAEKIGFPCVIKAQCKTGHRGQAGGVKLAKDNAEAVKNAEKILPMTIQNKPVNGVLVTEAKNILHEYYISISTDRQARDYVLLATAQGGTEVEEIAATHPEYVKRFHISLLEDFNIEKAKEISSQIGFYHAQVEEAAEIILKMWNVLRKNDAALVEINPLAKIQNGEDENCTSLCALDAKITLDDNAAFRHPEREKFQDPLEKNTLEQKAKENGLHYVKLDGQVGVIGNGAGLVMSSLDAVAGSAEKQGTGIKPANFLDIGGGASAEAMAESLSVVISDPEVKSIFINIYGGITSCESVAQGILQAFESLETAKPLVVRFDGNAAKEGLELLKKADNPMISVKPTMEEAAAHAAQIAAESSR